MIVRVQYDSSEGVELARFASVKALNPTEEFMEIQLGEDRYKTFNMDHVLWYEVIEG